MPAAAQQPYVAHDASCPKASIRRDRVSIPYPISTSSAISQQRRRLFAPEFQPGARRHVARKRRRLITTAAAGTGNDLFLRLSGYYERATPVVGGVSPAVVIDPCGGRGYGACVSGRNGQLCAREGGGGAGACTYGILFFV